MGAFQARLKSRSAIKLDPKDGALAVAELSGLERIDTPRFEVEDESRRACVSIEGRRFQQLELCQAIETRALKQKHATQRWGIHKTPRPGTWRHFVAQRSMERDPRAIRLRHQSERSRDRSDRGRER